MPEYVSASQINKFDDSKDNGCQRRWGFRYIAKLPDPAGAGAKLGGEVHEHLENFLRHKQVFPNDRAGKLAYKLLDYCHEVIGRPGLEIEGDFHHREGGVYYYGKVDVRLKHPCGFSWIRDWKTSSDPVRYGLRNETMLADHQAVLYARQELVRTGNDRVMLDWVYVKTKPPQIDPFAVRAQFTKKQVDAVWPRTHAIGLAIEEAKTRITDPNDLRPNRSACHAYGKPCPFMEHCHGAQDPSRIISDIFRKKPVDAAGIIPTKALTAKTTDTETEKDMSKAQAILEARRRRQGRKPPMRAAEAAQATETAAAQPEPEQQPEPDKRPGIDPDKVREAYDSKQADGAEERAARVNAPEAANDDEETQREVSRLLAVVIEQNPGRGKAKEARETYQQTVAEAIAQGRTPAEADAEGKAAANLDETGKRLDKKKAKKKAAKAVEGGPVHPSDAWLRIAAMFTREIASTSDYIERVDALYAAWLERFGDQ